MLAALPEHVPEPIKWHSTDEVNLRCIRCDKSIRSLHEEDSYPAYGSAFDDAGVDKFGVGYGSQHDCGIFLVAICDECITQRLADGAIRLECNSLANMSEADYIAWHLRKRAERASK